VTGDTALESATRVAWHAKTASDVEAHLTEVRLVRDKGLCCTPAAPVVHTSTRPATSTYSTTSASRRAGSGFAIPGLDRDFINH
jgi:hypothetical protein